MNAKEAKELSDEMSGADGDAQRLIRKAAELGNYYVFVQYSEIDHHGIYALKDKGFVVEECRDVSGSIHHYTVSWDHGAP